MSLPSDPAARELARQILAGREYARYRVDEEAWRSFLDRLVGWLDSISRWFDGLTIESPVQAVALYVLLLAVAALLLAHVVWSIRAALVMPDPEARSTPRHAPRDRAREAADLAAAGRYLAAARTLQIACLELLIERGALELQRAEPNAILRRRLARSGLPGPQRGRFLSLLDALEARVFRDGEEDPRLYEGWRALHEGLRRGGAG